MYITANHIHAKGLIVEVLPHGTTGRSKQATTMNENEEISFDYAGLATGGMTSQ